MNKKEILICECNSTDHQMIFLYDDEDVDYKSVYMHIHLAKLTFWNRLKYGIKYIFGYQSKYGAFDEFIVNTDDANKFKKIYEYLNIDNCGVSGNIEDVKCLENDNFEETYLDKVNNE